LLIAIFAYDAASDKRLLLSGVALRRSEARRLPTCQLLVVLSFILCLDFRVATFVVALLSGLAVSVHCSIGRDVLWQVNGDTGGGADNAFDTNAETFRLIVHYQIKCHLLYPKWLTAVCRHGLMKSECESDYT